MQFEDLRRKLLGSSHGPDEVIKSVLNSKLSYRFRFSSGLDSSKVFTPVWIQSGNLSDLQTRDLLALQKSNILVGPNVHIDDTRNLEVIRSLYTAKLLVPCNWVANMWSKCLDLPKEKFIVWAAGVDDRHWAPEQSVRDYVLIYVKDKNSISEVSECVQYLNVLGLKTKVITYGEYSQKQYRNELSKSFASVWLTGTESQGLAMFQAWSMDVPTLVRRRDTINMKGVTYPSSSAPYLDSRVGMFSTSQNISVNDLNTFFAKLPTFEPRRHIIENFRADDCTQKLIEIFEIQKND